MVEAESFYLCKARLKFKYVNMQIVMGNILFSYLLIFKYLYIFIYC